MMKQHLRRGIHATRRWYGAAARTPALAVATTATAAAAKASTLYNHQQQIQTMLPYKAAGAAAGAALGALIAAGGAAALAEDKGWLTPEQRKAAAAAPKEADGEEEDSTVLVNWSGTHTASTLSFHEPDSVAELEAIVAQNHAEGKRTRVVGSAISPNGIGLSDEGMLSIACLDRVLEVDKERMTCRVEAGARVSQVVDELRQHGELCEAVTTMEKVEENNRVDCTVRNHTRITHHFARSLLFLFLLR